MAVLYNLKLQAGVCCSHYGPDWTDSAPGMLPLICAVMFVLAAHPFGCTVLHKCLSVSVFTESGTQLCHYTAANGFQLYMPHG